MDVRLLYEDRENPPKNVRINRNEAIKDLNLDIIFKFMARSDKYIYKTVRSVMMNCLLDGKTALYRQSIITDAINMYDDFVNIYDITSRAFEEIKSFKESIKKSSPSMMSNTLNVLHSLEHLGILVRNLEVLKTYIDDVEAEFSSLGMKSFYNRLESGYSYDYEKIKSSISEMNFLTEGGEITFSAALGKGLKSI